MPESESRPLHLHTLDSLLADLVSGRPVETATRGRFFLESDRSRSALDWYRNKRSVAWAANVTNATTDELIAATLREPPELTALAARPANANSRRLRLKKLEAHRFAGLHKFGTPGAAPENYVHEFTGPLTLFEGRNGSGKTSLLNSIIWALTGEMLRPQREPESAEDFKCWVDTANGDEQKTTHKLSPLTPLPNVEQYRPDKPWILADTWVELTFIDDADSEFPKIRRSLGRTPQGKLIETPPDISSLGIDPVSVRIGTIMPGLLPLIRVGSESELGRAVSQLTGLSALVDLADHARRAKTKIDKEFVKAKTTDRDKADREFSTAKSDLERILHANETLRPPTTIPQPSGDPGLEQSLREITEHFEHRKAAAFESARGILGERFDPTNLAVLSDLEGNIDRALERASQPQGLASAARLGSLRRLAPEQIDAAAALIESIRIEANALDTLARDPSIAARTRLYARVATWVADHPDPNREEDTCIVCGGNIEDALDPVTGKPVKVHMHEAALNAALLSQTIGRWAESAHGLLLRNLPEALRAETVTDLPAHPCDLLRAAFTDELFAFEPFKGVLGELKAQTAATLDDVVKNRTNIEDHSDIALPKGAEFLIAALSRLDRAIRFARWRQANDNLAREILARVIGRLPKPGQTSENVTVTGKLLDLQATVKAAKPVSEALIQCDRLRRHLRSRRTAEFQLRDYAVASAALADLIGLGQLADEQVDQLRTTLSKGAAEWRSRIYLGAFPDTAHELVDTGMGRKGEIDLVVQTGGVSAPAQHVTNASALRASLVAFFLAFWEFVLNERGGLVILALDDPQELLDDENRERLAAALAAIIDVGGQLFVTSYDPRFCAYASRLPLTGGIEHLEVHPATRQQPVVRTTPPLPVIKQRKDRFEADRNAEEPARDFADGCRVFLEAKLGDIFDDPAHAAWAMANPDPTLATFIQRLRPTVRSGTNGMFGAPVFRRFIEHRALIDKSPVLTLMNKAHHGRRQEIRAADVAQCANDLNDLVDLVEQMFEECYRWRRRDAPRDQSRYEAPPTLAPTPCVGLSIQICQDLAAFTQGSPLGASEKPPQPLDTDLLSSAAIYYLRRSNFGFAAPLGSLAVVEAMPAPGRDRSLVIARHESATYARRLVRSATSSVIGLTADVPDPRSRTPKTIILPEAEVAIHRVMGIIFDHSLKFANGQDEAVLVDAGDVLRRIKVAFRIDGDSAVPLALDKQLVLGGAKIKLDELGGRRNVLAALMLDDGSSVFKRIGDALPNELGHLRQFESIGGIGESQIYAVTRPHKGFRHVTDARIILGVLYDG